MTDRALSYSSRPRVTSTPALSVFRSPAGAAAYRRAYERTLSLWPSETQSTAIPTRFGLTRVNVTGHTALPPLLLIHGFGLSSTQWHPNVGPLSAAFRIYAPDLPDQFGLSSLSRLIERRDHYALWLLDLIEGLGLSRVRLAGHSYGGWLAAAFAIRYPERVRKLALIAPAATFAALSPDYFYRGMFGYLASGVLHAPGPVASMMQWMSSTRPLQGLPLVEQLVTGMEHIVPLSTGLPDLLTPADAAPLTMPTLLMLGEHEVIYRRHNTEVIEAATRLLPHLRSVVIPAAGHLVAFDQPLASNIALLEFLID